MKDVSVRRNRILTKLLVIMTTENKKPWPIGPFTKRWARAWWWYYEILKWDHYGVRTAK